MTKEQADFIFKKYKDRIIGQLIDPSLPNKITHIFTEERGKRTQIKLKAIDKRVVERPQASLKDWLKHHRELRSLIQAEFPNVEL